MLNSLEITELTGEEYLGSKYVPFRPPVLAEAKKDRSSVKKAKTPKITYPPVATLPFEERWDRVVAYHKNHTFVSEKELSLRFALLKEWRETQLRLKESREAKYVVYWPPMAGLGNTVSFLGCALLLSMYSGRRFLSSDEARL